MIICDHNGDDDENDDDYARLFGLVVTLRVHTTDTLVVARLGYSLKREYTCIPKKEN